MDVCDEVYERLKRLAIDEHDAAAGFELYHVARRRGDHEIASVAKFLWDGNGSFEAYLTVCERSHVYGWRWNLVRWLQDQYQLTLKEAQLTVRRRRHLLRRIDHTLLPSPGELAIAVQQKQASKEGENDAVGIPSDTCTADSGVGSD